MSSKQDIIVYTTNFCGYCDAAKRLLKELNLPFSEVRLDSDPDLRIKLSQENGGWRTVPMIFVGDRFIGGFTELSDLHRSGGLAGAGT